MMRRLTDGLTRLLLALTLLATTAGFGFASGRASAECPLSRMHGCCKKAQQKRGAHGVVPAAQLCCVVNCPQPAPTGTNYTFRPSPGTANAPHPQADGAPLAHVVARAREYSPPFQPSHSPPAYIQHAAFLI